MASGGGACVPASVDCAFAMDAQDADAPNARRKTYREEREWPKSIVRAL
jgi:hypothetical protein